MKLIFSKYINGEPTYFKEKIGKSLHHEAFKINYNVFYPFAPKIHTIRRNKAQEYQKGIILEMYYNEAFEKILDADCTGLQGVFMTFINGRFEVSVEDKYMYYTDIEKLALNDGFSGYESFRDYFMSKMDSNGCYSGDIIHWTKFRY